MTPEETAAAIGAAGYAAYRMTLVGSRAPIATAYFERVTNPQPGDLVVETSTFHTRDRRGVGHEGVGTLQAHAVEHIVEPPSEDEPEGWEYDEEAWHVAPVTGGDPVRWTNASFVAIPRSAAQTLEWSRP